MNVLLILSDHFRSDCLKHVGNEVIRTPNLDRLASEGVSFSASPLQPSDPSERLKTPLDKAGSSAHTNDLFRRRVSRLFCNSEDFFNWQ